VSFLELAREAERRLWGCEIREKRDFSPLREAEAREPYTQPPREKSGRSEKSPRPLSRYSHPWPDEIPLIGPRHIEAFTLCANCGTGTWAFYGPWPLCLHCANLGRLR